MAAGSPIAALEPARPASPLKALSFWGAGLVQSRPPAFPAKMSKLWASSTAPGTTVRNYQSPPMVNVRLPRPNLAAGKVGSAGGWPLCRGTWRRRIGAGSTGEVGSLPPCGGGLGRGVPHGGSHRNRTHATSTFSWAPPLPRPPPRGGRERSGTRGATTLRNGRPFWNLLPCPPRNRRELSVRHSYTTTTCSISHLTAGTS